MTTADLIILEIKNARVCSECDLVTNAQWCPVCCSSNLHPLSTWLNRTEKREEVPSA